MHDLSARHKLQKKQEEVDFYMKMHKIISEHLIDPLSLISVSASWLLKWHKKACKDEDE